MAGKPGAKESIESPMTGFPPVKAMDSDAGIYNRHPSLGPKGESGGLPLKFFDELDNTVVELQATDNPMYVAPTKKTTS